MRRVVPENGAVQRRGIDEKKRRGQREIKEAQRLPPQCRRRWCGIRDSRLVADSRPRSDLSGAHDGKRGVTETAADSQRSERLGLLPYHGVAGTNEVTVASITPRAA